MLTYLLLAVLIKFSWLASAGPVLPTGYKLCIGSAPGACTITATVPANTLEKVIDLNVSTVQYATVIALGDVLDSDPSGQVVVGKPLPPTGLVGRLSGN